MKDCDVAAQKLRHLCPPLWRALDAFAFLCGYFLAVIHHPVLFLRFAWKLRKRFRVD